ncbi:MAG: hypothetical protein ACKO4M_01565 [Betaproteobacteria bacterium]
MRIFEITAKPKSPLTPEQARIQALKNQAKRSQAAVKAERARQQLQSAQRAAAKANSAMLEQFYNEDFSKITEASSPRKFQAQIKLRNMQQSSYVITDIIAANQHQAKLILEFLFGKGNVIYIKSMK